MLLSSCWGRKLFRPSSYVLNIPKTVPMSLMKIINGKGPRLNPCGIPEVTSISRDKLFLYQTLWFRLVISTSTDTFILSISIVQGTLSKPLGISVYVIFTCLLSFNGSNQHRRECQHISGSTKNTKILKNCVPFLVYCHLILAKIYIFFQIISLKIKRLSQT